MVFSNLFFLYIFMPLLFVAYFIIKSNTYRSAVLVLFSLLFYAWGEPKCIFIMMALVLADYVFGLIIDKVYSVRAKRTWLAISIVINLSLLCFYKYLGFFTETFNAVFNVMIPVIEIAMPIGISFFTFQSMSYVIDVYRGDTEVQKSYFKLLLYVSFFPQLIAGPIVRYKDIADQIGDRHVDISGIADGLFRFSIGLAKKVLIANNLSTVVDSFFKGNVSELSVIGTWFAVIAYAMQIYFDFSGYSDMAIGLGRVFGFHFDENFKYPFICKDVSEFWQRWHISLGSFFRDYLLYIPIFGKRRKYGGLFLVWFCTGLWHGASWNYIIWGLYFGAFIFIEMLIGKKRMKKIPIVIRHIYNKIVIIIGFGIFYFEDFSQLGDFFKNLIGLNSNALIDEFTKLTFTNNVYLLILAVICCFPIAKVVSDYAQKKNALLYTVSSVKIVTNIALLLLCSVMLVDATNNPFLYFRF